MNQVNLFDITAGKHGGNAESVDANKKNSQVRNKDRKSAVRLLRNSPGGLTSKDIARLMNKPLNAISGRLSELKAMEIIKPSGERREGCAVLVLDV